MLSNCKLSNFKLSNTSLSEVFSGEKLSFETPVQVTFETEFKYSDKQLDYTQTSGPLVFPNTYPYDLCSMAGEGIEIDCSGVLDAGIVKAWFIKK